MSNAREQLHSRLCTGELCVEYGDKPSPKCQTLNRLLDQVEEAALHKAAMEFEARMDEMKWPRGIGPGVSYMAREMDPYEKVDAFDPEMHDVHPSEFSDCPKCGEGVEHWHIKGTQNPAPWV